MVFLSEITAEIRTAIERRETFTAYSIRNRIGGAKYQPVADRVRDMFTYGNMPGYDRRLIEVHITELNEKIHMFEYFPIVEDSV